MLTEEQKSGWRAIDKAATEAGGYLAPPKLPHVVEMDYRAMSKYCREVGKKPMELTEDELEMFFYDEPIVYA